ncbi:MAG: alpha/beta hydrolase [Candidatus Binatia bacterium]|nr:alpha/beta hydrolase [Candidatus Binatia bacterium]
MIWREEDDALGKETTFGTDQFVQSLELHYLSGVSHWVQQEAPEQVNSILENWLKAQELLAASGGRAADP